MSHSTTSLSPLAHTDRSVSSTLPTRVGALAYGIGSYLLGVASLLVLIGTSLGLIELGGGASPLGSTTAAVFLDLGLLVAFALQHSVMARPAFKARWTRIIRPSMERATYLVATALVLTPMLWLWQPVPIELWSIEAPVARALLRGTAVFGWAYLFVASFALDHFELFGLRQVWDDFRGRTTEPGPFKERWMYAFDRHPIMTGVLLGMWATPDMSVGRLLLVGGLTAYIAIGVHFEERALLRTWGDAYEAYRERVGSVVPRLFLP